MSWDSEFAEPIGLPNNVVATTLRQVIEYISELSDAEQNSEEWQKARKHILQAADQIGSIWFARISVMQALQRDAAKLYQWRSADMSAALLRGFLKMIFDIMTVLFVLGLDLLSRLIARRRDVLYYVSKRDIH
jgi:hypothetical protein